MFRRAELELFFFDMHMHIPVLPVVRIRFQNAGANGNTLRWAYIGPVVIALFAVFPMLGAWRLSRQETATLPEITAVSRAATPPPASCDAAVNVDRLSTDFTIVLLTPAYADRFAGLQQLEEMSKSEAASIETRSAARRSLEEGREFLKMSQEDPRVVDVRRLAQVHAELNHALADLSAELRHGCHET